MSIKGIWVSQAPFIRWVAVANADTFGSPGDTQPDLPDAIYIGTTGDLVCTDHNGNSVTFKNVPQGTVLLISPILVTTAPASTLALYR